MSKDKIFSSNFLEIPLEKNMVWKNNTIFALTTIIQIKF